MFKKTRNKIVFAIMFVLILLLIGTFAIIYLSSYIEVNRTNRMMLEQHAKMYVLNKQDNGFDDRPHFDKPDMNINQFKLSTFYSVAISKEGNTLEIKNNKQEIITNTQLESLAYDILQKDKQSGVTNKLNYYKLDKGSYTLIAFMDNTILRENIKPLFRYTFIYGSIALVLLFVLSMYLAKRIVKPIEISYQKQKQFISDAGHELKTPVSVINANAEILSREIGENQWLENIQYENECMGKLVCELLDLARVENVQTTMSKIDFSHIILGTILSFEAIAFEKGLVINSKIDDNAIIMGNANKLNQLVSILIDNAIVYNYVGKQINVTLTKNRNNIIFSVENMCEDIPQENLSKLFERFYRIDTVRNSDEKHYGLGLSIAKAIVEEHKGKINVNLSNGKIIFEISLPKL